MKKLYCLSGLGVDERAYKYIQPKDVELIHITWIKAKKGESLKQYANRLFDTVQLPEEYNLIGVSFGGMIATEFSKIRPPKQLILVSTLTRRSELPIHFKIGGLLHFTKLFSSRQLKKANFISFKMFGITHSEHKLLLKEILQDTDSRFLKWALHAITTWKNNESVNGVRIHGTKDKLLPATVHSDYLIKNGGHFIIVTEAKRITEIIEERI